MEYLSRIRAIIEMTKPLQTFLLMITMIGGYFAAGGNDILTIGLLAVTGYASIGGTTILNMYLERDIDSVMERTKKRPLPRGVIGRNETVLSAIVLLLAGVFTAGLINKYVVFSVLAGVYFDILIYTNLVKRRTPYNIVLGGVAGAMPSLGGWTAATGGLGLGGIILAVSVMLWIPLHIWILAYYIKEDYLKAQIPMFPVLASPTKTATYIKASLYMLILSTSMFMITQGYGIIAFIVTFMMIGRALRVLNKFIEKPSKNIAFRLYKFASPIIGMFFLLLPLDYLLRGYECQLLRIMTGG